MASARPTAKFLTRPTGPMLRLLRQLARAPAPGGRPGHPGRSLGYAATLNGLLARGLVAETEVDGVTAFVPTAAGRRELASANSSG